MRLKPWHLGAALAGFLLFAVLVNLIGFWWTAGLFVSAALWIFALSAWQLYREGKDRDPRK